MKKYFIFYPAYVLFLLISLQCQSQISGSINGEGDVVKQEISLESLRGVNLGFSGDVILTQGSTQKIVMEGQQNILDNIKRDVKNGVWKIDFDKNVRDAKKVTIYVTLATLKEVGLTGSGQIRSTNKFSNLNDLEINVAGSGSISLDYEANATDMNLSGSGQINLSGKSNELSIAISGSGDVLAGNLKTENCEISISGSGDATVYADKNLETRISGSGDVLYSGNASVNTHISGSGDVSKISQ